MTSCLNIGCGFCGICILFRRDVMVLECNAPLATWMKAVLVVTKKQGLACVVIEREREDGSRSGETATGRSRGRRK